MSTPILYFGLDVHKDSDTAAVSVPRNASRLCSRIPYGRREIRRFPRRLSKSGEQIRAYYEASGAGYVLQRKLTRWGYHGDHCAL